ncbi:hypothetical protein A2767_07025 [Candidatus Roizmanbacteria bacterium RIFCSPHIGHO2_01_FULL_35_10]|uniref:HTH arsR-type domain-containing protein n=1 Tax=Candidatus Roizmanbacteria bacterium RIFCSPLOWO2_01_FULL_35_13 TaxID=1802055 RepID=A0A1F7I886_9BACT|nr:MAG: hypothetical protein A2767_07025 [Candidatus Roizmanbacteria bacterium RIFCSPHIGHO2_01_FULL_35_10]OGK39578.1 MAG: hypothetical protein A3A74_06660 [Candidatus Roizmanbacteria bacterium RIFCSPLOWO2_01_FULL_35_13]
MLDHIIPSKARRKILALFFQSPNDSHYLRKIVRDIGEEVNAVKRELDILSGAKLLHKEKRLNKIFYSLNKSYLLYDEFLRIFAKSSFLAEMIYKNLSKIGKVKFIVISTKFVKQVQIKEDEIYLLIVGIIVVPEVAAIVGEAEKQFGREVNYTVMAEEEFAFRKKNNDPFIWRFLKQPKVMLVGTEDDLLK